MNAVVRLFLLLVAVPVIGAAGLMLIEPGYDFFDALYMAVTTITTVGFGEIHPLSRAGRAWIMVYLVVGLGAFLYAVVEVGKRIVETEMADWWARRRMDTVLKSIQGHYIICGFGRMGRTVCRQLAARRLPFVAVDRDEAALAECRNEGWHWVVGDATDDRALTEAGIQRARGLAAMLAGDVDNLYVVLSARLMSADLQIIARASDEKNIAKLQKAGANRVVGLYDVAASKMTQLLANPNLEDFFEILSPGQRGLDLAEIHIRPASPLAGVPLSKTDFTRRNILIVAIRRPGGELLLPPPAGAVIKADDVLIAMGSADVIAEVIGKV